MDLTNCSRSAFATCTLSCFLASSCERWHSILGLRPCKSSSSVFIRFACFLPIAKALCQMCQSVSQFCLLCLRSGLQSHLLLFHRASAYSSMHMQHAQAACCQHKFCAEQGFCQSVKVLVILLTAHGELVMRRDSLVCPEWYVLGIPGYCKSLT